MSIRTAAAIALATFAVAAPAADQLPDPAQGYLCCNMRTDGKWISDSNYQEGGKHLIPAGTPVKAVDFGRQRVYIEVNGGKQAIGNDYSRDLDMTTFAKRYIVAEDPTKKLASASPKIREAVATARVMPGMTREQVLMSLGYPISSENPHLDAKLWRYWVTSFAEFQVLFEGDKVKSISADERTRNLVVME